jgi:tetratricopeptide (TPR) repeat protein
LNYRRGSASKLISKLAALLAILAVRLPAQSNFPTLAAQADAARNADHLEEAAALYRKALALKPTWAEGWWDLGTILYDRDDYAGAADALHKAVDLNPRSATALAMLGLSESKIKRDHDALQHLKRALELGIAADPNIGRVVLYTQGTLLLNAGAFGQAQERLDTLARTGADQQELLLALGEAVLGIRPIDLSATASQDVILSAGQAEFLSARREVHSAFEAYTRLAQDFPKTHNVQFAYARFLLANHEDNRAVSAFRSELENTPQHLLARLGLAGILLNTDPAAGLPYALQAVQLAPALEEARYLLGALLLATKDLNKSIPELETARRQDPADSRVYFQLERAYTLAKRPQDAARARAQFTRLNNAKPE